MQLVKTLQPQVISEKLGISETIYFKIGKRHDPEDGNTVEFDVIQNVVRFELRQEQKHVETENEDGSTSINAEMVVKAYPILVKIDTEVAKYKTSTFESETGLNNPVKSQFYNLFPLQIQRITEMWENDSWTGNEIQKPKYWNLKANDLQVMSHEEVELMLTPFEVVEE